MSTRRTVTAVLAALAMTSSAAAQEATTLVTATVGAEAGVVIDGSGRVTESGTVPMRVTRFERDGESVVRIMPQG